MKTVDYIRNLCNENRDKWFAEYRATRAAVDTLESIYGETIHATPAVTVKEYVSRVGYDMAVSVIATLVNRSAWDGRISRRAAQWAETISGAFDEKAAVEVGIYSNRIHCAHLDRIALAAMKIDPPSTPDDQSYDEQPDEQPAHAEQDETPQDQPAETAVENNQRHEIISKEDHTMKKYTFTAHTLTACGPNFPEGKTFPARYELQDSADMKRGQLAPVVHVFATVDEKTVKIDVPADDAYYYDALKAAQEAAAEQEQPDETPDDHSREEQPAQAEQEQPAPEAEQEQPDEQPAQAEQEQPAPDPKQAHGPIPEKTFVGTSIKGARFEILFDGEAQRTRVIIPAEYRDAARATVEKAGFYYSAPLDSWNKKLTFRAYRAAVALAAELEKVLAA